MRKIIFMVALLFSTFPVTLEAQQRDLGRVGSWQVFQTTDVMTDDVLVTIVTQATNVNNNRRVPLLIIACDTYTSPVIMYSYDKFYAGNIYGQVVVEYRVDSNPVTELLYWDLIPTSNDAASTQDFDRFMMEARGGTTAYFRVTDPFDGERLTDTFNISRLDEAIRYLPCFN
jgi:hypothetical protein